MVMKFWANFARNGWAAGRDGAGLGRGQGVSLGWREFPTYDGQTPRPVTSNMRAPCNRLAAQDRVSLLSLAAYEPLAEMKPRGPWPSQSVVGTKPLLWWISIWFCFRNPNGEGLPHWPAYDHKEGYLQIGVNTQAAEKLKDKEVAFWNELLSREAAKKAPQSKHVELWMGQSTGPQDRGFSRSVYVPKRHLIVESEELSDGSGRGQGGGVSVSVASIWK